jgi:FHS family L-fucose permease-like MFS transporter
MTEQARTAYIQAETALVKGPYFVLGTIILLVAILFFLTKLPEIKEAGDEEDNKRSFLAVLRHKNVSWGVVAQFFYVGAQVYVLSFLLVYATDVIGINGQIAKYYVGVAGLLFMLGRFVGTFFMRFVAPGRLLTIYSTIAIFLTLIVIFGSGMITLYALVAIPFFMSIMFPTIFAMGIEGVGTDTKPASSLIIMAIVGGAVIPPLAGLITDLTANMQYSYLLIVLCFAVVYLFARSNKSISQGKGTVD